MAATRPATAVQMSYVCIILDSNLYALINPLIPIMPKRSHYHPTLEVHFWAQIAITFYNDAICTSIVNRDMYTHSKIDYVLTFALDHTAIANELYVVHLYSINRDTHIAATLTVTCKHNDVRKRRMAGRKRLQQPLALEQ